MSMVQDVERLLFDLVIANRRKDLSSYLGRDFFKKAKAQDTASLTLSQVKAIKELAEKGHVHKNTYFQACDIYIRQKVEPLQFVLNNWMHGAKAQVNGKDIEFSEVISWCQGQDRKELRDSLEKEVRALCRFLSPFSQATWKATFEAVEKDLGFDSYLSFLKEKKGQGLENTIALADAFLSGTSTLYFELVNKWFSLIPEPVAKEGRSRFDAVYLLGMRYLDILYPPSVKGKGGVKKVLDSLSTFLENRNGLVLHVKDGTKGHSYCLPMQIPQEIHVVTGDIGGWIDLEGLFHELGHAFFLLNNSPHLEVAVKDFYTDFSLGETFAFVFQLIAMDKVFLSDFMGLPEETAGLLEALQAVKFLVLARRYAAKSLIEHENFSFPEPEACQRHYAKVMKEQTGFRYQPETYFFDLMPDLYSLDYFQAFLGAWVLRKHLKRGFGSSWFKRGEAASLLKGWAAEGNLLALPRFLESHAGSPLSYKEIVGYLKGVPFSAFPHVKKMAQKV